MGAFSNFACLLKIISGHRGCDHMAVGYTTTCAVSAYHH